MNRDESFERVSDFVWRRAPQALGRRSFSLGVALADGSWLRAWPAAAATEAAAAAEADAAAAEGAGESASEVAAEESAAESADDILSDLRPGRNSPNLEVDTPEEMQQLFDRLSAEGTPIEGSRYPGDIVELADGTRVGLRPVSRSGGETIDLFKPDGTHIKVHLP